LIELSILLLSFFTALLLAPWYMERLASKGFQARDMYKPGQPLVPTMGGLIVLTGMIVSLIPALLLFPELAKDLLTLYLIISSFAVFGLLDDLVDVGKKPKIVIPIFLALPIALLNLETNLSLGFTSIELGSLYRYVLAPMYVMVVANLVNMHSGYNGLASGLSTILLATVGIAGYLQRGGESLVYLFPILGAELAFLYYNRYPSRVFEGNTGSLLAGSALGSLIVLNNLELFGVIILIPHIVNFLMYLWLKLTGGREVKFGGVNGDGTLHVPHPVCLKWTLPYYIRMTELQATLLLYSLTGFFSAFALWRMI